jgi:hypothetical protein
MAGSDLGWFSVRCVFRWTSWEGQPFEERITLWRAHSLDEAIEMADREAREYAADSELEYLRLTQGYQLDLESNIDNGTELFSLLRDSNLSPEDYVNTFFSTGTEHSE